MVLAKYHMYSVQCYVYLLSDYERSFSRDHILQLSYELPDIACISCILLQLLQII